ncbi:hypothetical protein LCO01nite_08200 [Lapidilactobacillus concavus]|nr:MULTISPECIES: radical SAM protein [Lapidilactobacillus]GEL13271.1 hypothetical protein LCO01nite_08200 [Lapidilactobacillus concavus]
MYFDLSKFALFHWYKEQIYGTLISGEIVRFNVVESYLLELYFESDSCSNLRSKLISLGLTANETEKFIAKFLNNNENFLSLQDCAYSLPMITGEKGKSYPLEFHVSLTNKCFLKCKHCYKGDILKPKELDFNKLVDFLNHFIGKVPLITLSGGEPTLYRHFNELIDELSKNFLISFSTSGFKIAPKKGNALIELGRNVQVSLYYDNPLEHDSFTQVKGSFKSTTNFIRSCIARGHQVSVTTLFQNDTKKLYDTIAYCAQLGVSNVAVGEITNIGRASNQHFYAKDFTRVVNNAKRDFENIIPIYFEEQGENLQLSCLGCIAGTLLWSIFEDGDIYGCGIGKIDYMKIGTINELPIEQISDNSSFLERMQIATGTSNGSNRVQCPFKK